MSNKQAIHIIKTDVVKAGNTLGVKPNQLAKYLGFDKSNEVRKPDKNWESILPVLLRPLNFSGITILFEDDSLLLTNVVTNEDMTVFCGNDDNELIILPMEQMEMVEQLTSYLGEIREVKRIKQELSYDEVITILLIADSLKRIKLKNMLNPNETEFDISLSRIRDEFKDSLRLKDLRWLSTLSYELRLKTEPIDFDKALKGLSKKGIIEYKNEVIDIDENGIVLFEEISRHKSTIGIRSAFYYEGVLNYLAIMLLRTENHIWYLELSDNANMMTLNTEETRGMIATMLAPGENPPESQEKIEPKIRTEQNASVPRFCRNCGASLSEGAKFCRSCGKKI